MNPTRKILLGIGMLVLLALAWVVWLDEGAEASGLQADGGTLIDEPQQGEPRQDESQPDEQTSEEQSSTGRPPGHRPLIVPGAKMGIITGRIGVSSRVVDKLTRYTILVQEDVNPNAIKEGSPKPFSKKLGFDANVSQGTPYFDITDIPFSRHAYRVTVVAEGMNGSSDITHVNKSTPTGSREVQLRLTPGAIFSVMLRDQRRVPRRDLAVRLRPIGTGMNRRAQRFDKSNRAGNVLFLNVLQGEYKVIVGPPNAPLAPPKTITVHPASTIVFRDGRPEHQSLLVTVPDGHHVTIDLWSKWGYPIENAELKAYQLDVTRYYPFKGTTNRSGRCVFENMPFGKYQLSVRSGSERKDLQFKVEKGVPAPTVTVKMRR